MDAALPVSNIARLTDLLDEDVAARRIGTIVLIAFAAFAVLLAIVGIYGVISYFVVQHTSEIGVRIALGAQARDVLTLVAGKGLTLALAGVGIGSVGAIWATHLVSSLLYGFSGFDPIVLVARVPAARSAGPDRQLSSGPARDQARSRRGAAARVTPSPFRCALFSE